MSSFYTISLRLQISISPLSGLMMMSKLSSEPYFFFNAALKTSSKIAISVTLSMSLSSLNSENDSINAIFSIRLYVSFLKYYYNLCFFNISIRNFNSILYGFFSLSYFFRFSRFPLQYDKFIISFCEFSFDTCIIVFLYAQDSAYIFFILSYLE